MTAACHLERMASQSGYPPMTSSRRAKESVASPRLAKLCPSEPELSVPTSERNNHRPSERKLPRQSLRAATAAPNEGQVKLGLVNGSPLVAADDA